jgi:hypothetical protein
VCVEGRWWWWSFTEEGKMRKKIQCRIKGRQEVWLVNYEFIYGLFNNAISKYDYIVLNDSIMNNELQREGNNIKYAYINKLHDAEACKET